MRNHLFGIVLVFCAVLVAACGGGGGGGSSAGGVVPTATPAVGATPTLAANPTPTGTGVATAPPTASGASYTVNGRVVDADNNNAPLAGATVQLGNSFAGGTLSAIVAATTTASDGTYSFASVATTTKYIQVTLGSEVPSHRAIDFVNLWQVNEPAYLPTPNVSGNVYTEHDIYLTKASADESAALVQMNADRVTNGTGGGQSALALDADMEITARYRASEMAQGGWYSHTEPGTNQAAVGLESCKIEAFCGRGYYNNPENIDEGPPGTTLALMEIEVVGEGPSGGHFQTLVDPNEVWVGFGEAFNGISSVTTGNYPDYFVQDFVQAFNGTPR